MADYDSTADTHDHIRNVQAHLDDVLGNIEIRSERHDLSKLESPEKEVFDVVTPKLRSLTYGSDEYKASLAEMGAALTHHYQSNRHHPEHYGFVLPDGGFDDEYVSTGSAISNMSLLDLIEMLADWKAATACHADGDIIKSLDINRSRFGIGDQLYSILVGTVQEMGW